VCVTRTCLFSNITSHRGRLLPLLVRHMEMRNLTRKCAVRVAGNTVSRETESVCNRIHTVPEYAEILSMGVSERKSLFE
jgi:hypothetical protein